MPSATESCSFAPARGARTGECVRATIAEGVRGMMAVRDAVRYVFRTQLDESAPEPGICRSAKALEPDVRCLRLAAPSPLLPRKYPVPLTGSPTTLSCSRSKTTTRKPNARIRRRFSSGGRWSALSPPPMSKLPQRRWQFPQRDGKDRLAPDHRPHGAGQAQLQRELDDLIDPNPEGGEWETADRYLSGDVRAKNSCKYKPPQNWSAVTSVTRWS